MSADTDQRSRFGLGPSPEGLEYECGLCEAVYYGVGAALGCCGGRLAAKVAR